MREPGEHPLHVFCEAHLKHLVRFIQNQPAQAVQLERAAIHVVHDPARSTNDDMNTTIELPELKSVILAAVDRYKPHSHHLRRRAGMSRDLDRPLASRREDEDLRYFA